MAGRTSINDVAAASAMTSTVTSNLAATATASLTTATTTVSAIRDVSTASGRPSRRDQLNSGTAAASATTTTTSNRGAGVVLSRSGVNTTSAVAGAAGNVAGQKSQITSRSYAGSPTGHYPGPVNGYGRGNVPQSISSSAFTIGTSRYTR